MELAGTKSPGKKKGFDILQACHTHVSTPWCVSAPTARREACVPPEKLLLSQGSPAVGGGSRKCDSLARSLQSQAAFVLCVLSAWQVLC